MPIQFIGIYNSIALTCCYEENIEELSLVHVGALALFTSLPNNKVYACSKLKAFADHKTNVTENLKSVWERVENMVGKGENAGYQGK